MNKIILFTLIGLCALQSLDATVLQPGDLIGSLLKFENSNTEVELKKLDLMKKVREEISLIKNAAINEIIRIEKFVLKTIDDLKQAGIDITHCALQALVDLKNLPSTIISDLKNCILSKVGNLFKLVTDSINLVLGAIDTLSQVNTKLGECLRTTNPIKCAKTVINEAMAVIGELPAQLKENLAQGKILLKTFKTDLFKCITGVAPGAKNRFIEVIHNAETCIETALP